jgi:hypothetical protein
MAAESYSSLTDMEQSADAVVVGRIVDVREGRQWVANASEVDDLVFGEMAIARFANVTISVEEIIGGTLLPIGETVSLEIFLPEDGLIPSLQQTLPLERAVFFLRNKGPSDSTKYYTLVNDTQGLVREFAGVSHTMDVHDAMLHEIEGKPFTTLLATLRSASD